MLSVRKRVKNTGAGHNAPRAPEKPRSSVSTGSERDAWWERSWVALVALLAVRAVAAALCPPLDCDETYNYWEPLHYLVYGSGLQTWEYGPQFALRSYLPLWLWAAPARLALHLAPTLSPYHVWLGVRVSLVTLHACADTYFYRAARGIWGAGVARAWLALALGGAGPWAMSAALLPSAWSGALTTAALAACWRGRHRLAVWLVAASALLSWPFAALLGVGVAWETMRVRGVTALLRWALCAGTVLCAALLAVDWAHYGRPVLAPFNILAYNLLTEHGADLYGVEPAHFYLVNGLLNFNVAWVAALLSPLVACWYASAWLALAPLWLWLGIMSAAAHKEERFLQPAYCLVLLGAALVAHELPARILPRRLARFATTALLITHALLGVSRAAALVAGWGAPLHVLQTLKEHEPAAPRVWVCVGADWYRLPGSFLLPDERYRLRFIKSDFSGQLPAPYAEHKHGTRVVHAHHNARNEEDARTYLTADSCHYLVSSRADEAAGPHWRALHAAPLLQAERSPRILRSLYVPGLWPSAVSFTNLTLYVRDPPPDLSHL